jgi:hypothetical protein
MEHSPAWILPALAGRGNAVRLLRWLTLQVCVLFYILAAGLAVSVSGSGVSHRVLRGAVQSELKEKYSVVKPGIRLL